MSKKSHYTCSSFVFFTSMGWSGFKMFYIVQRSYVDEDLVDNKRLMSNAICCWKLKFVRLCWMLLLDLFYRRRTSSSVVGSGAICILFRLNHKISFLSPYLFAHTPTPLHTHTHSFSNFHLFNYCHWINQEGEKQQRTNKKSTKTIHQLHSQQMNTGDDMLTRTAEPQAPNRLFFLGGGGGPRGYHLDLITMHLVQDVAKCTNTKRVM